MEKEGQEVSERTSEDNKSNCVYLGVSSEQVASYAARQDCRHGILDNFAVIDRGMLKAECSFAEMEVI